MFYFVLAPIFGIDRFWAGVLCLAAFEGSFAAEIIRGGIQAVERGQYEAGDATGLSKFDKYRYVIIPQALPLILPPLTGLLISLIKHSAIVSVIAVAELTTEGLNLISDTYMAFEIWFIVAEAGLDVAALGWHHLARPTGRQGGRVSDRRQPRGEAHHGEAHHRITV